LITGSVDVTGNDSYHVDDGRGQADPAWGATTISHYFPQHLASTSKLFRAPLLRPLSCREPETFSSMCRRSEQHAPPRRAPLSPSATPRKARAFFYCS